MNSFLESNIEGESKMNLFEKVQVELDLLVKGIEIKWDRYTMIPVGGLKTLNVLNVYGWIPSDKHEADFLIVTFFIATPEENIIEMIYNTSSIKYSLQFNSNWGCESHSKCKKWDAIENRKKAN